MLMLKLFYFIASVQTKNQQVEKYDTFLSISLEQENPFKV